MVSVGNEYRQTLLSAQYVKKWIHVFLTISVIGCNISLLCWFNWKLDTNSTASSPINISLSLF